jgi:dephospho-CoA kinase
MFSIGLTGGIGSGKTQVADLLASFGASVIDTDAIAHALTASNGLAIEPIRAAFGDQALTPTGALDREYMRNLVFDEPLQRKRLEAILHPIIATQAQQQAMLASGSYTVFVVPLLVESGRWRDRVDRVCVVDCDPETQIARVQARSGMARERIERIMQAQVTRAERLAVADDVIDNGAHISLADLSLRVLGLHQQWCNLAQ